MTLLDDLRATPRPSVTGELPGPRSAALLARQERRESNARVYGRHFPIAVDEAGGSFLRDVDGNVFIDFLTGAGVLSLGHNHPELVAAATEQLGRYVHGLDLPTPAKDAFTEAQLSMLPGRMADRMKMHFCGPTGANAVDAAIKLCKTATGRGDVISFQGGFHGTTHAGMALTGNVANKRPIANGVPGVHFFPFSNCASCPLGLRRDTCATNCIGFLENALHDPNGGVPLPAAVLVEMVQGEGGVVPADNDFVRRLRDLTRELEIPLVVDEVQTGCGRTGTYLGAEADGVRADACSLAKGIAGGFPLGAILVREQFSQALPPGTHASTFGGNALACAAGLAVLAIFDEERVLENVQARGQQLAAACARIVQAAPAVGVGVRGRGLLQGIVLASAVDPLRVLGKLREQGVLATLAGGNVLRICPALNITQAELDEGMAGVEGALVALGQDAAQ
jgi:diaminobutyrate-2-oxoglutarate transaminase